jgi:L-ascorbate metabolism protein UlaG (beta-lactamase superfamily)
MKPALRPCVAPLTMTLRLLLAGGLMAPAGLASAQVLDGSRAFTFPENDNQLIALQRAGGDPAKPGPVKIEFYGHDAFKITSPLGMTVLFDPWRNDPTGFWGKWFFTDFPEIRVEIAVSTHAHFDHDATHRPHAFMVMDRPVGEYRFSDVKLTGLADKHQCAGPEHHKWHQISAAAHLQTCPPNNPLAFDNMIQVLETGGLKIAVWGDNRPRPGADLDRYLENVDVLILPIDDTGILLTYPEINAVIARYKPKAIIPAHYLINGLSTDVSGFETADGWVKTQRDVRAVSNGEITLTPSDLGGASQRVYYFGGGYKTK